MTVYVDSDDLKKTLTLEGTTFRDEDIDSACVAASAQVEKMMNRDYGQSAEDTIRFYTARDSRRLVVHDLVDLTSVKCDDNADGSFETTWDATDYVLEPFNAVLDGLPFTELTVPRYGTRRFPVNVRRGVEITGVWGWPSPPQQVVEAAALIAAQVIKRKVDAPFGFVIGVEAAAYIAHNDPTIKGLLHDLGRRKLKAE